MRVRWIPGLVLALGAVLTLGAAKQVALPLERSMGEVIPGQMLGYLGQDLAITDAEAHVAGFSNYLFRVYELPALDSASLAPAPAFGAPDSSSVTLASADSVSGAPLWFSLYVGYYESQAQGNTIHSPKNCLPGAGWEPLSSDPMTLELDDGTVTVNRYILQNGPERALALYWYQGRGRIAYDEYRVKLDLLRDATFRRRSDEALVRIVVPMDGDGTGALDLAKDVAALVIPNLDLALPGG